MTRAPQPRPTAALGARLDRLRWLAGQVGPVELAARLRLKALEALSRGMRPRVPHALEPRRVFPALADPAALRDAFERSGLADAQVAEAERVLDGQFTLFAGFRFNAADGLPDWLAAFPSGDRWSDGYSFDVDISGRDGRDVRFTWELSRHGDLAALARAALLTGQDRFSRRLAILLDDWVAANPFLCGPNWRSPLEVGVRALTWTFIDDAAGGALDERARRRFIESLFLHGLYLERFLSRGINPSNHIIGEAAGLFVLGCKLNAHRSGRRWRARAARILHEEMARQAFSSGVSREQSTGYHRFVAALFAACVAVEPSAFSERFRDGLARMYGYLAALARPDGSFARFGDGDDACALRLSPPGTATLESDLSCAAAIFPAASFRLPVATPESARADRLRQGALFADSACAPAATPEVLWLFGPSRRLLDAPGKDAAQGPHACRGASVVFPDAGFAVLRSSSRALQVEFDAGPQGYTPVASHGHADALSVTLWRDGDILVDTGTYRYNGAPLWRDAFRSTPWHNTVTVDVRSHAAPASAFRWLDRADASLAGSFLSADLDWVSGTLPPGPSRPWTHRRDVIRAGASAVILIDDIASRGAHTAEAFFHFGDAWISCDGSNATVARGKRHAATLLALDPAVSLGPVKAAPGDAAGCAAPLWQSTCYGVKTPCQGVVGRASFHDAATLRWLMTFDPAATVTPLPVDVGSAAAVEILADGRRYVFLSAAEWGLMHVREIRFVGRWGFFEMEAHGIARAWGAEARALEYQGRRLFTRLLGLDVGLIYQGSAQPRGE